MKLVYLDYNCFQRGFDDPLQTKIRLEATACEEIFARAERGDIKLVWSFMHQDENITCPFVERKMEVDRLSAICKKRIGPESEILSLARDFQQKGRLASKDAVHIACAHYAGCMFFITCDDVLIRRAKRLKLDMNVINPVDYIMGV